MNFEWPKPGLLVMWGSAAWAQTQLTPGVSVLAAPRQIAWFVQEQVTKSDFVKSKQITGEYRWQRPQK
jgi:hypothetical protein